MKRRGFFRLLGAAAAAPVVAKAAEPGRNLNAGRLLPQSVTLCEPERFRLNHEADNVYVSAPVEWNAPFDESDYLFAVDRDDPTPTIDPESLAQAWIDIYDPWAPRNGKCRVAINGTTVRLYSHPAPGPLRRMEETQALLDHGIITVEQAKELAGLP